MWSAAYQRIGEWRRRVTARRSGAAILAITIELLILVALLTLGTVNRKPPAPRPAPVVFQMMPDKVEAPKPTTRSKTQTNVQRASGGAAPRVPHPPTRPDSPLLTPDTPLSGLMQLSRRDYAKSDISKIPSQRGEDVAGKDAGAGDDSGSALAAGSGAGGAPLYYAEWVREPTRAEMVTYLPKKEQTGWGLVKCKSAPRNRVEDCRIMAESPSGSGLGRAVQSAAWQFLIRPPRIGGKPIIGAPVWIKYDLVVGFTR